MLSAYHSGGTDVTVGKDGAQETERSMNYEPYDYSSIAQHPKLLTFYGGWLGQKIYALAYLAVLKDQHELWITAAGEVDRLVLVLHEAEKAKHLGLSGDVGLALGEVVGRFTDGGWWTSAGGTVERAAHREQRRELDEFPDYEPDTGQAPFQPQLVLEHDAVYPVAAPAISALDTALLKVGGAMNALDVSRLGVLLSGFCYRTTPRLDVGFVNSVLNDLASHDLTDLEAENEFRRAVGLSEVAQDRRPLSITHPTPMPAPSLPSDGPAVIGGHDPFARHLGSLEDHNALILACVFRRFDLAVPSSDSDSHLHAELASMKKALHAVSSQAVIGNPSENGTAQIASDVATEPGHFWVEDTAKYLGADRLGVNLRKYMYRLLEKGSLPKKKINGRYVFYKSDLDMVIANGDQKRGRGRPRGSHSA